MILFAARGTGHYARARCGGLFFAFSGKSTSPTIRLATEAPASAPITAPATTPRGPRARPTLDAPRAQPAPPSTVLPMSTHRFLILVSISSDVSLAMDEILSHSYQRLEPPRSNNNEVVRFISLGKASTIPLRATEHLVAHPPKRYARRNKRSEALEFPANPWIPTLCRQNTAPRTGPISPPTRRRPPRGQSADANRFR